MARLLPVVGEASYNGFTFPAPFNAEVSAQPRRDSANRVTKFVTYTITIRATIVPDDAPTSTAGALVDDNLENIRCRLLKSGGSLRFIGQGFGTDFVVNDTSTYTDPSSSGSVQSYKVDVEFGPHPQLLLWRPVGSNRAVEIVWTVQVTIPECCGQDSANVVDKIVEHSYTATWDITDEGVTTRIIKGRYEIPGLRSSYATGLTGLSTQLARIADQSWDFIYSKFPTLVNFHREHNRSISSDKKSMEYTIIDTEIASDNPFFPYLVKISAQHRVSLSILTAATQWENNLSAQITLAPRAPRALAWIAFRSIIKQRFDRGKNKTLLRNGESLAVQGSALLMPLAFTLQEDLYSREFSFSFDWWFQADITKVFEGSGLFTAISTTAGVGGAAWVAWKISMAEVAYKARSNAEMGLLPSDDIIITACDTPNVPEVNSLSYVYTLADQLITEQCEPVTPEQSYISYRTFSEVLLSPNVLQHRKVKDMPNTSANAGSLAAPYDTEMKVNGYLAEVPTDADKHVMQVRGPSLVRIRIQGVAVRVKFKIPIPKIATIGGKPATIISTTDRQAVIGKTLCGDPIYKAHWQLIIATDSLPTGDLMANISTDGLPEQHSY